MMKWKFAEQPGTPPGSNRLLAALVLVSVYFIYKLYSRRAGNRITRVGRPACGSRIDAAWILAPVEMLMNDGNITTKRGRGLGVGETRSGDDCRGRAVVSRIGKLREPLAGRVADENGKLAGRGNALVDGCSPRLFIIYMDIFHRGVGGVARTKTST